MSARRDQGGSAGKEIRAGLMVGAIWGLAEYVGNIILFRLHWGYGLEIDPRGLFLSLASYSGIGFLLALLSCAIHWLPSPSAGRACGSREGFSPRVVRTVYVVACVSIYLFLDATFLARDPLFDRRTLPYIGSFATLSILVYLGLKRLAGNRLRRARGRSLAFLAVASLLGLVGTTQYLAVYHRLTPREDLAETEMPVIRDGLPNLLLVTVDTLRPDHLGCYGSPTVTTETFDALARQGVLFENVVTSIPQTLPSHTSIMTSLYPESHGVLSNVNYRLQDELLTLAEILRQDGYRTAAFVSSVVLARRRGLDQGFEHYDDEETSVYFTLTELLGGLRSILPGREIDWGPLVRRWVYHLAFSYRKARFTTDRATEWWRKHRDEARPGFVWVHYYDPHIPLNPPEPYAGMYSLAAETRRTIRAKEDSLVLRGPKWEILRKMPDPSLYDGEVTYVDHELGRMIRTLEDEGLTGNTLIVVTADHGEHLTEHDYFGHTMLLYRPSVDVPLMISHRGQLPAGVRVPSLARTIDIAPTILDHLGLPIPESMEGRSLLSDIGRSEPAGTEPGSLVETFSPHMPLLSYVKGRWTFIMTADGTKKELYDDEKDPDQRENVYEENRARADSLEAMLRETRTRYAVEGMEEGSRIGMDAGTLEKLRALGYVR